MVTYFISDLHLNNQPDANSSLLLEFLQNTATQADALYILGDLFAIWFGDDLDSDVATQVCAALKKLQQANIPIYFMHGNRDFLINTNFLNAAGLKLLPDPYVFELYGKPVLLTHGDLLCTLDHKYQKYRSFVHNFFIRNLFLALPKVIRLKIGNWVRNKAKSSARVAVCVDQPKIYDVDPATVVAWLNKYNVNTIIHGHTHQAALHKVGAASRIVLGDWNDKSAVILKATAAGFELVDLRARL